MWVILCFDTDGDFGKSSYIVRYDTFNMEIRRGTLTECHNLCIETTQGNYRQAHEAGRRFLSELAWLFDTRAEILTYAGGGGKIKVNVASRMFNRLGNSIHPDDYEQVAHNDEQKLALGLYREGVSSNSHFHAFLSYFKILNIKCATGQDHKKWINANISRLQQSKNLYNELKGNGITDFGEHLYGSGRCAIAHASVQSGQAVADPDNYDDNTRISKELPLIKELAGIFIRDELDVPDRVKSFQTKLLRKFKELFGEAVVKQIAENDAVDQAIFPTLPNMSFHVYECPREFCTLSNLNFAAKFSARGNIILSNRDQDWPLHTEFIIDFLKKEINFDIFKIGIDKSHKMCNEEFLLDYYHFLKALLPNGRLEIWNVENAELIARLLPYIPVNIDLEQTMKNFQMTIDFLEGKLKKR